MNNWNLRYSILTAAHRWYIILASLILGGLLGALAAFLWPSPFRASSEILVELNPYRALDDRYIAAFAQTEFRNVDDYKYWQMQQLDGLAFTDEYLHATLSRLKRSGTGWQDSDEEELGNMLTLSWRNAGEWRLIAESADPDHAMQALQAWKAIILEKTNLAIASSQELFKLELQLRAIADSRLETQLRLGELEEARTVLARWQNDLSHRSDPVTLTTAEYWQLWSIAARAAGNDQNWRMLLSEMPSLQSPVPEHLSWLDELSRAVVSESQILSSRSTALDREHARVFSQWQETLQKGQGLAATLRVESATDSAPQVDQVRPVPLAILAGSALGFLFYVGYSLATITRRGER